MRFPDPGHSKAREVVAIGCDFSASTLLLAYRSGIFPWPHGDERHGGDPMVLWFSPDPRAIFPLDTDPCARSSIIRGNFSQKKKNKFWHGCQYSEAGSGMKR